MAVKDSIGGWKNNALNYQSDKGFTTFKNFFGTEWSTFTKSFHVKEAKSPGIPPVFRLSNLIHYHYIK